MGSEGSDARIGKADKDKNETLYRSATSTSIATVVLELYLQFTIVSVQSVTVSLLGPYWSSDVMAFDSVTREFE